MPKQINKEVTKNQLNKFEVAVLKLYRERQRLSMEIAAMESVITDLKEQLAQAN